MTNLGKLLQLHIDINKYGVRGLGRELGLSGATVSRIINGKEMSQETMVAVFNWLFFKKSYNEIGEEKTYTQSDLDYHVGQEKQLILEKIRIKKN